MPLLTYALLFLCHWALLLTNPQEKRPKPRASAKHRTTVSARAKKSTPKRLTTKRRVAERKETERRTVKRGVEKKAVRGTSAKAAAKARPTKKAVVATARRPLGGTVFYLASGHGGPDPGALGKYGKYWLPEDEYAYDVTIRLATLLKQQGATVFMIVQDPNDGIRNEAVLKLDHDEVAYPRQHIPLDQLARLNQTTTAVNRLYARNKAAYQRFITIHVDSRSRGEKIDVFFYHHSGNKAGKRLAKHIHKRFKANYKHHRPDRPYSGNVTTRNELYVVRNSRPPVVFIELGNIQNGLDQRRFLLASNRSALANWLMQGIIDDYQSR